MSGFLLDPFHYIIENMISLSPQILTIIVVLAVIVSIFSLIMLWIMHRRISRLLVGKSGGDLEKTINDIANTVRMLVEKHQDTEKQIKEMREQLRGAMQHIGVVRFNPFADAGGDQSFAIALLDEDKNGVVISSLYSREGVRVYGKPIEEGKSPYSLSDEEERAITLSLS